jgi:hypothetical protein
MAIEHSLDREYGCGKNLPFFEVEEVEKLSLVIFIVLRIPVAHLRS